MRTTDNTASSPSDSMAQETRRTLVAGLRGFMSVVRRLTQRKRNNIRDLSEQQLRDIGLDDGQMAAQVQFSRAQRQDERLRQAHQNALYIAIGLNGR